MKKKIQNFELEFPAVRIAIAGKEYIPDKEHLECEDLVIDTSWSERGGIFFKHVSVRAKRPLPTPDFLEVDRQTVPDPGLKMHGYLASVDRNGEKSAEEEGRGIMPGCGYPLIGDRFWTGLAHPTGFNRIESRTSTHTTYSLRHHPVWQENRLESFDAVYGVSDCPEKSFLAYLETIRMPFPGKAFFAFCSFWSDPYLGNYEYNVSEEGMKKFIGAYNRLGLHPDAYTFDAGWQNRKSFFEPKPGLEPEKYSDLSLWISHNGPAGIDPEFLRKQGFPIGGGRSSAYSGEGYAVLLDPRYEKRITQSFCKLAKHVLHFKIDWDNECATSPEFREKYPTADHVREGSINAMFRIMEAIRKVNPNILVRNGNWPSPWHLLEATHLFLTHSGDSEYISLPTLHQRASAATHRDFMYYNILRRDGSEIPLDAFDNHEFPNSIRNAFNEDDVSFADNLMLCLLRGSTYFQWTVQPEGLSESKAKRMKQLMQFARDYPEFLFSGKGRMFGGNPGRGEIYGFTTGNEPEYWGVLRNPAPMPQFFEMPPEFAGAVQFYPDYRKLSEKVLVLPEEVKVFRIPEKMEDLPFSMPFQAQRNGDDIEYRFPSSKRITCDIGPMVADIQTVPEMNFQKVFWDAENQELEFQITVPYRVAQAQLRIRISNRECGQVRLRAKSSRYPGKRESTTFGISVTEIAPGVHGVSEIENPETIFQEKERFFQIPVPPGGESYIRISFGMGISSKDLEVWLLGYEDPSRNALLCKQAPCRFTRSLPPQHPAGFPIAEKLDLPAF